MSIFKVIQEEIKNTIVNEAGVKALKRRRIPTFIGKSEEETRYGLQKRLNKNQYNVFIDYYDNGMSLGELSQKYNMDEKRVKSFIISLRKKISNYDPTKPLNPNIDYENGRFKKGAQPWNKDKRGYMGANKTSFTTDTIKHAEVGKPQQGHNNIVTATDEKKPVVDKRSGKTYMVHKRESYPRWLLKQNGIDVPSDCVVWHIDGDYTNNDLSNLEVITRAESIRRTLHNRKRLK